MWAGALCFVVLYRAFCPVSTVCCAVLCCASLYSAVLWCGDVCGAVLCCRGTRCAVWCDQENSRDHTSISDLRVMFHFAVAAALLPQSLPRIRSALGAFQAQCWPQQPLRILRGRLCGCCLRSAGVCIPNSLFVMPVAVLVVLALTERAIARVD